MILSAKLALTQCLVGCSFGFFGVEMKDYPLNAWTGDQMSVSYACALRMKQLNHISIKGNDQYGGTAGEHDV